MKRTIKRNPPTDTLEVHIPFKTTARSYRIIRHWKSNNGQIDLYCGDCSKVIPVLKEIDVVITDPPYPDFYTEEFAYEEGQIVCLTTLSCRQFIFWSAKVPFPLDFSAIHVWNKITGAANQYDFIYERNGYRKQKVFTGHRINSSVSAQFASEHFYGHKSQKPLKVLRELLIYSKRSGIVLDPFMGSGSTIIAGIQTGHKCIGIEINPDNFTMAKNRVKAELQETPI